MPEGDTVYRTARHLDRTLSGAVLLRSDFRVPQHAGADLSGGTVLETLSRGKHLLTRVDREGERWTLHTHLKMEGAWRVLRPRQRWPRPEHQARVVLETADAVAVGFSLGIVELVPRADEDKLVGHLGPDLLGPDWDEAEAVRRLQSADRSIGEALLDQRSLAGVGTMYMAETLFLAGVCPMTPVSEVRDLAKIVRLAFRLLNFNKSHAVQVTTGNKKRGEQLYVFFRTGEPCRRCGTKIVTDLVAAPPKERRTYWCPSCQPLIQTEHPTRPG